MFFNPSAKPNYHFFLTYSEATKEKEKEKNMCLELCNDTVMGSNFGLFLNYGSTFMSSLAFPHFFFPLSQTLYGDLLYRSCPES